MTNDLTPKKIYIPLSQYLNEEGYTANDIVAKEFIFIKKKCVMSNIKTKESYLGYLHCLFPNIKKAVVNKQISKFEVIDSLDYDIIIETLGVTLKTLKQNIKFVEQTTINYGEEND